MCLGSCVDQITELVKAIVGRSGSCFQALLRWPCTIYLLHTYKVLLVGSSDTTCNLSSERRLLVSVEEFSVATLLCLIAWLFIKLLCFSYIKKNPSSKPAKMCVCVCALKDCEVSGAKKGDCWVRRLGQILIDPSSQLSPRTATRPWGSLPMRKGGKKMMVWQLKVPKVWKNMGVRKHALQIKWQLSIIKKTWFFQLEPSLFTSNLSIGVGQFAFLPGKLREVQPCFLTRDLCLPAQGHTIASCRTGGGTYGVRWRCLAGCWEYVESMLYAIGSWVCSDWLRAVRWFGEPCNQGVRGVWLVDRGGILL